MKRILIAFLFLVTGGSSWVAAEENFRPLVTAKCEAVGRVDMFGTPLDSGVEKFDINIFIDLDTVRNIEQDRSGRFVVFDQLISAKGKAEIVDSKGRISSRLGTLTVRVPDLDKGESFVILEIETLLENVLPQSIYSSSYNNDGSLLLKEELQVSISPSRNRSKYSFDSEPKKFQRLDGKDYYLRFVDFESWRNGQPTVKEYGASDLKIRCKR